MKLVKRVKEPKDTRPDRESLQFAVIAKSLALGCVIGSLPYWMSLITWEPWWIASIKDVVWILMLPGGVIGMILTLGQYHDINPGIATIANCVIYSAAFYYFLRRR